MCDMPMGHREEFDPYSDMRHLHRAEEVRSNPKRLKAVRDYMDKIHRGFEQVHGGKRRRSAKKPRR